MTKLTANQQAFIRLMSKSDEHAQRGFQLLISKPDPEVLFDAIQESGLLDPQKAPGPVPAEEPGYYRIPYWAPLDYLEHLAQLSGERQDTGLAEKVMSVVRGVSRFRVEGEGARDNYHTYRIFAEIIGLVPREALSREDLNLIPVWLDGKFDRSLVGSALSKGVITRLIESDASEDWEMACLILNYCTELRRGEDASSGGRSKDLVTVVDGYFLKEIIAKHAENLGRKVGRTAATMFIGRIKEAFSKKGSDLPSYMLRPAVEEHDQNRSWKEAENCLVEGLRDILLSWVLNHPEDSRGFVVDMLNDETDMIRRIGIYLLNERWTELNSLYGDVVGPDLFDSKHIHEMYQLLKKRFGSLTNPYKEATVTAIRELPLPKTDEDPEGYLRHKQRNWLSAIAGQGFQPADEWFDELNREEGLGRLSDHPDFHYYMETGSGPGPSPYELEELLSFVENGSIVEKLNAFEQTDSWRGPSVEALVTVLEKAVASRPEIFLRILPKFKITKRAYQYGVISGFKSLWAGGDDKKDSFDWDQAWDHLIGFFEGLLYDPIFWTEAVDEQRDLTPTRDWIPPSIAEFLRSGTRDDEKSYSPELLPRTFELIKALLDNLEIKEEVGRDAMSHAINSSKGKSLEALFSHALRACRVEDKKQGGHADVWAGMEPVFNKEIEMCMAGTNYDFSTLSGAYLPNLDYLSKDWLNSRIEQIFPFDLPENFRCAVAGLTYASATKETYRLLMSKGIIDKALGVELNGDQDREKIVERIALAYLWGDEELDGQRLASLLHSDRTKDLQSISHFFRSVRGQKLDGEQVERILNFWGWCVEWGGGLSTPPERLFSSLGSLVCFMDKINEKSMKWLMMVAPFVSINHNADDFIKELDRLAEKNSGEVCEILGAVLANYKPSHDYKDRLRGLLQKLADGGSRIEVIGYANKLRHLKGVEQLYRELI